MFTKCIAVAICLIFCRVASCLSASEPYNIYEGYKVYNVLLRTPNDKVVLSALKNETNTLQIDFWNIRPNQVTFMVPPQTSPQIEQILNNNNILHNIAIDDVSNKLKLEKVHAQLYKALKPSRRLAAGVFHPDMILDKYLSHKEINQYLDSMATYVKEANPNIFVAVDLVGQSYEGREIKTITITSKNQNNNKDIIFIDAGIHAREWTASAFALYMVNVLSKDTQDDMLGLLNTFVFIIIPCLNPDGYEFSRTKEKLWRKTRKPNGFCIGTDGNRNYDVHWNEGIAEGDPCGDAYRGNKPFSESETQIVKSILEKIKPKVYLTLHSYGNYILYPYGYSSESPPQEKQLALVAQAGVNAVYQATGVRYTSGSSGKLLYIAPGGSDDYALDVAQIPYAFTFEIGSEEFGFAVPTEHIQATVEEGWIAVKAMFETVHLLEHDNK